MTTVVVACAGAGAAAGIAGSAAAPSGAAKQRAAGARFAHPFGRREGPPVHAEAVVLNRAGNGFVTVTEDAGTVKTVSGSDVTIIEGVGSVTYKEGTITIPSDATVYRNGAKAAVGDLKGGDRIHVARSPEGTTVMAFDASFARLRSWDRHGDGPWRGDGPRPGDGPPPFPGPGQGG